MNLSVSSLVRFLSLYVSMHMSQGEPKECDSCKRQPLLEFYSCKACPPQASSNSFDLCLECCDNHAREAHQAKCGATHSFVFTRRPRQCDGCNNSISDDFMMCEACPQNMDCYDLCLTCTMSREPMRLHGTSPPHTRFRYVKWLPNNIPSIDAAQGFRLTGTWHCDGGHPQCRNQMGRSFFHCLDCGDIGFDLCAFCADKGGIFHHRRSNRHRFAFVAQVRPLPPSSVGDIEPPPPYRDDRVHHA